MLWYFSAAGKQMVWKGDGLSQHYLALCYYARWGKAVLGSLLSGRPAFPTFNMHMGFGSDLFTTLQYYVIGDPFSLPAVFVPQRYMLEFHDAMIVLRMYLAGLSFDGYCLTMGRRDLTGNLCGALVYVFSTFALFGMRHPYFLNAMIWFPLLLTGAERILRGSKGRFFTIAVFLSCISNFYFFYMLVLMTVVYVVWRACRIFLQYTKGVKVLLLLAGKFLARGVLGSAMGACFLLPILIRFVGDPRAAGETVYGKLYSLSYYTKLPEAFVAFGTDATLEYWTCLGFGGIGLVCVLLLILDTDREKKLLDLRLAFAGMLLLTVLPSAGAALNGFSYPSNRWTWAFALLAGYITAVMVPSLARISWKKAVLLLVCINLYAVVCYLAHAHRSTYPELALAAVAVLASVFLRALGQRPEAGHADAQDPVVYSGKRHPLRHEPDGLLHPGIVGKLGKSVRKGRHGKRNAHRIGRRHLQHRLPLQQPLRPGNVHGVVLVPRLLLAGLHGHAAFRGHRRANHGRTLQEFTPSRRTCQLAHFGRSELRTARHCGARPRLKTSSCQLHRILRFHVALTSSPA